MKIKFAVSRFLCLLTAMVLSGDLVYAINFEQQSFLKGIEKSYNTAQSKILVDFLQFEESEVEEDVDEDHLNHYIFLSDDFIANQNLFFFTRFPILKHKIHCTLNQIHSSGIWLVNRNIRI